MADIENSADFDAENYVQQGKARLQRELVVMCLLLLLTVLPPFIALAGVGRPEGERPELWFMRSGAVSAIGATYVLFRMGGFLEKIRGGVFAESWVFYKTFNKHHTVISNIATFFGIASSIIWGYGDLMYIFFR